jgi:nucleoside-diphosphate-sugar epimerase
MNTKILVTAANGNTGFPAAKELLNLGFDVRATYIPADPLAGDLVSDECPVGIAAADKHVFDLFHHRCLVYGLSSIICAQVHSSCSQIFSLEISYKK